ncbi:hypothetical protein [Serratia quinivorans]|nr:hypothetical protein [Serratia quinivorans]
MAVDNQPTLTRSERRWRALCLWVLFPLLGAGIWALMYLVP